MNQNQGQATGRATEKESTLAPSEAQHQDRPQSGDGGSSESTKKRGHPQTLKQKWMAMSLPNKLTAIFTALLFVATSAYAIFSGYQLRVLQRQLDEMKGSSKQADRLITEASKQADSAKAQAQQAEAQTKKMGESLDKTDRLIRATGDLAKEAKRSADAAHDAVGIAKQSLDFSERSIEIQERPWLGITTVKVDISPAEQGQPITGSISFSNSGKSPAFDVELSSACSYDQQPIINQSFVLAAVASKAILMPGDSKTTPQWNCNLPLNAKQYALVRQGVKKIYVYGEIVYKDDIGSKRHMHVTRFCQFSLQSSAFADCPEYNSAD